MRIPFEKMYQEFLRVLIKIGFEEKRAQLCARLFTETSRDGVYTHGLNRFPRFISEIKKRYIDIHSEPVKVAATGPLERWDGNLGPGNLNAFFCMNRTIDLAKKHGMGCLAIKNTNHWMRGGTYGWQAADAGYIAICWTNTKPNMPPWGAAESRVGNNPLVLAVPKKDGHVVLDTAMSLFSYGKMEKFRLKGEQLPFDGGFNSDGELTRDPDEIEKTEQALPMGYWKGSGLALLLDLIASLLSDGKATKHIGDQGDEYGISQVFVVFDTSQLSGDRNIFSVVDEIIDYVHEAVPISENGKIYYPGEKTLQIRKENNEKGIPVDQDYWQQVLAM